MNCSGSSSIRKWPTPPTQDRLDAVPTQRLDVGRRDVRVDGDDRRSQFGEGGEERRLAVEGVAQRAESGVPADGGLSAATRSTSAGSAPSGNKLASESVDSGGEVLGERRDERGDVLGRRRRLVAERAERVDPHEPARSTRWAPFKLLAERARRSGYCRRQADTQEGRAMDLIRADDSRYDEARTVFNAMVDKRPAVIARCASPTDVVEALALASREGWEVAVRAGGHSVAGVSVNDGGLVVDVRPMNRIEVEPDGRQVRVGAGVTWGEFDRATQEHGLATTGGRVSTTGVAGLTLGGGSGWLERRYGLTCDNLISVDLVTADGRQVTASEDDNPDLFWALHGGGGNFGVATSFVFRLHPVGPLVTAGLLLWAGDAASEVARRVPRRRLRRTRRTRLSAGVSHRTARGVRPSPPARHDRRCHRRTVGR